jgi:UDP-galactopyranose mutase
MDFANVPFVVVGAGFFGAVVAERIANDLKLPVVVLEKRPHLGGNSFSETDAETGIEFHKYGPHIFHTSDESTWSYLRAFTEFNSYRHRGLTTYRGRVYSMPINLGTINHFFQTCLSPDGARALLAREIAKERPERTQNLEDEAISLAGRSLYEAFVKGYTLKQWGLDPKTLPASIISRLPVRYDYNDRYFSDTYEGIPLDGYRRVFERMLSNPLIRVHLNTDFFKLKTEIPASSRIIYTGAIDRFFDYRFGSLSWRTVLLEKKVHNVVDYQGTSVMNYADVEVPYTRIHEPKHFHPERKEYWERPPTLAFIEYSRSATSSDEPYYPVNTEEDKKNLELYRKEGEKLGDRVVFGGRLATYKYLDMHQVIGAALVTYKREIKAKICG